MPGTPGCHHPPTARLGVVIAPTAAPPAAEPALLGSHCHPLPPLGIPQLSHRGEPPTPTPGSWGGSAHTYFIFFLHFIISNHVNNSVKHPVGKARPRAPAEGAPPGWGGTAGAALYSGLSLPNATASPTKLGLERGGGYRQRAAPPARSPAQPLPARGCPSLGVAGRGAARRGGVQTPPKAHSWGVGWPWRAPPPRST